MNLLRSRLPVLLLVLATAAPWPRLARAQESASAAPPPETPTSSETRTVVPAARYAAGALHRFVFGSDYRALWSTPIEVEVLDLERTAGGLQAEMVVGRNQTLGLAFRGADGNAYTFRSLDKDPTALLPPELLGTPIADLAQDQISSNFPGAGLVVGPLAEAAGLLAPLERLVILPDSERLGEHRERFAGMLGTFYRYPTPGSWGSSEIVDGGAMIERLSERPDDPIDARAFLRARLFDLWIGDWDRHVGQWRFARFPGRDGWQPVAEDRDQAFSRYDGIAMAFQRNRDPRFDRFGPEYPPLAGLVWNGRTVDRRLLTGLARAAWIEEAEQLRRRLDDAAIAAAVGELPAPWRALAGDELIASLEARRDALPEVAARFYELLAGEVDVWGSDGADRFELEWLPDGALRVRASSISGPADADASCDATAGPPYFERLFVPEETAQVRLYTGAGADRVFLGGGSEIGVRLVPGSAEGVLCGGVATAALPLVAAGGPGSGAGREVAPGVRVAPPRALRDAGAPVEEQGAPRDARRDSGSTRYTTPWFGAGPDIGFFGGFGWTVETFAFRHRPFAAQHTVRLGLSTAAWRPRLEYLGVYRHEGRASHWRTRALVSGVETLNFYGIGNETDPPADSELRRARRHVVELSGMRVEPLGPRVSLSAGLLARYSDTREADRPRLVNVLRPYGVDRIVQAGATVGLHVNTRDRLRPLQLKETDDLARFGWPALGEGFALDLDATWFPELLDLRDDYLVVRGDAAYTGGVGGLGLGLRVGGQATLGEVPYYDLAILGDEQVRGLPAERFTGSSSLHGNVVVVAPVGRAHLVIPGHWGLLARAGTGRVFADGENSARWHWGVGGGVWWTPWDYATAVRLTMAASDQGPRVYLRVGFDF